MTVLANAGPVEGLSNFRDFGGLATADGMRVVAGRFYRSANPAGVTPRGMARLARFGITTVIDLRGLEERAKALADLAPARIAVRPMPIEPKTSGRLRAMLCEHELRAAQVRAVMIDSYRAYVNEAAEAFGAALHAILAEADGPVLVHCTAGKDRTGFMVAVVQSALGVPRQSVVEDYLATNRHWDRVSASGHLPLDSGAIEPVLVADADYLAAAFEEIDRRDGDARAFIRRATAGRVTPAHLDSFVERSHRS